MVKQGYKHTELGVIPEDWECTVWENAGAGFSSGATPYRAMAKYYNGSIKWVSSGELNYNVIFDTLEHISDEAKVKTNLKLHPANTFLMAITGLEAAGTRGSCAILGVPATTNQSCMAIYGTSKLDVKYLFYFYTKNGDDLAFKFCQGTKQQSFTAAIVKKLPIVLPPIEEQKRIAEALSDVDGMISSLEKLIAKKKAVKQGAMQELLMEKKRLPGFTDEWEIKTLKEISHEIVDGPFGSDLKKEHYTTERQVRIIQLSNIGESGWNDENTKYTTFAHAYELSRCIVQPQAVLIAKMMPAGRAILCPNNEKGYILGSDVVKLIPNDNIDRKYLIYATKSQFYLDQIADDTQGSTRSRTSVSKLRKTSILFPPKSEQTAIASILSDMDNEIESLEQKLSKTRQIKQGMMQQLLTGKIRLV